MSIAVAVRKGRQIVLAADSQSNLGAFKVDPDNLVCSKIQRIGSSLLATTGWGLYENIIDDFVAKKKRPPLTNKVSIFRFFLALWKDLHDRYPFVNDQPDRDDDSPFGDLDASFLVVNTAGIFYVASDLSVTVFEKYYAVGSGADFALGAISVLYDEEVDAEHMARRAVETALMFDPHCGGKINLQIVTRRR